MNLIFEPSKCSVSSERKTGCNIELSGLSRKKPWFSPSAADQLCFKTFFLVEISYVICFTQDPHSTMVRSFGQFTSKQGNAAFFSFVFCKVAQGDIFYDFYFYLQIVMW